MPPISRRPLTELRRYGAVGPFARLFSRQPLRTADLEYPHSVAAASRADARVNAQRLMGMRQTVWRRRVAQAGAVPDRLDIADKTESRPAFAPAVLRSAGCSLQAGPIV